MLSEQNYEELRERGYTVVPEVLSTHQCDHVISLYKSWLTQFKDGEWPHSSSSLIQRYNTGNMEPTWIVRLQSKKVFSQLWGTDKLLSSIDAVAIGRPPEDGQEPFYSLEQQWLHLDQGPAREGLHAYQGSVNLEEVLEDDWTLQVVERSHKYFKQFYEDNERASIRADLNNFYMLRDEEVKWYINKGLQTKRVPVPKGGMVLWDSRLVHANANPMKGRKNPGRWRYCAFVSMTPAIWAGKEDLENKRIAHKEALMTTHWSSQRVQFSKTEIPSYAPRNVKYPKSLPEVATCRDAKLLSGVEAYDFNDGQPNGDELRPKWKNNAYAEENHVMSDGMKLATGTAVVGLVACTAYIIYKRVN